MKSKKIRVVAVDDDKDFLKLLKAWLSPKFEIECFSDSAGVLEQFPALQPDVVILDVYMPHENGFEFCKRIRRDPEFKRLPVIFLTSSTDDIDFLKSLDLGGDSYLNKPSDQDLLRDRIKEVVSSVKGPKSIRF